MLQAVAPASVLSAYALSALQAVSSADPNAVLAGGAVRDTLFNRPIKDIDVCVGPSVTVESLAATTGPGWEWHGQFSPSTVAAYREYFGARLVEVIMGTLAPPKSGLAHCDEPPVQVIVMDHEITLGGTLRGCDFGFCQVGLRHGDRYIWGTPEFVKDFVNNTATMVRDRRDAAYDRSAARATRLQDKYREFPFLDENGGIILAPQPPKQHRSQPYADWAAT